MITFPLETARSSEMPLRPRPAVIRGAENDADLAADAGIWGEVWPDDPIGHAGTLAAAEVRGTVSEDDEDSIAFVERRGFVEVDRIIELALDLEGSESPPRPPAGIQIAEVTEARYRQAYEVFAAGVGDIPTAGPAPTSSLDSWLAEVRESPLTLIALDGDRVVGYADLEVRNAEAGLLGNNLTTVARSHRRRGIAEALKRAQIAWAREHGYRRLVTATHATNEPMQRLNEKLGYRPLPATIDVSRRLGA